MGDNPRRPSFRLPWGEARDTASTEPAADESTAEAASNDEPTAADAAVPEADAVAGAEDVDATAEPIPGSAPDAETEPEPARPESAQFLRELVDAMRNVAESSRDTSLAELRTALDARVEQLKAEAAARAEEIRRRSEHDITGIGEWERTEIDRVRAEAEQRREARRAQLEQQLTDHQSAADRDVEGTRRKLADHERAVAAFFAELAEIKDPAVFVAAVKRMPAPPDLGTPNGGDTGPTAPSAAANGATPLAAPTGDDALTQRLAQLDKQLAGAASEGEPTEAGAAAPPATAPAATTPAAPAAVTENGETSTPIVVKGLGSFGAITSFKQALERVDGIRGVTLSLGPTGEFVYRANHAAAFDIVEAIRKIEGPGAGIEEAEGSILVTVGHQR